MIDNTSKTRAIFEINKGSNKFNIDVNSKIDRDKRRVPFENMIYIADGPSDIPVFLNNMAERFLLFIQKVMLKRLIRLMN